MENKELILTMHNQGHTWTKTINVITGRDLPEIEDNEFDEPQSECCGASPASELDNGFGFCGNCHDQVGFYQVLR